MGKKKAGDAQPEATRAPAPVDPPEEPGEPAEPLEEDSTFIKELKALDDEYLALERRYQEEEQELRRKYFEQQAPILERRTKALEQASASADVEPAVKSFWLQAMKHHPAFEDMVEEWDEAVLEHISDIRSSFLDDSNMRKGFKLSFHFKENPYFENNVIWKEYHAVEKSPYTGEFKATVIKVSDIKWKPGKNVTMEIVKKKTKGGGAKKKSAKAATQQEPRDSFFRSFFRNLEPGMPIPDDVNLDEAKQLCEDSDEDNEHEMMNLLMENDYEMGCAVCKQLIPFAVRWYTGEACPEWNCDDDDSDEDDDEVDDDDDDVEDSSDEEETFVKGKKPQRLRQPQAGVGKKNSPGREDCKSQ